MFNILVNCNVVSTFVVLFKSTITTWYQKWDILKQYNILLTNIVFSRTREIYEYTKHVLIVRKNAYRCKKLNLNEHDMKYKLDPFKQASNFLRPPSLESNTLFT